MYTLDKLKSMSIVLGNDTVDGELATYFISNLNNLSTMTLQKCIHDTGISKASIHRFYSKAGFLNFKTFVNVLYEEKKEFYHNDFIQYKKSVSEFLQKFNFEELDQSNFVEKLKKANKVAVYANIRDVYNFGSSFSALREKNKQVILLNKWDIENNYEKLNQLNENDVFIVINMHMNIQNYHEMSLNNDYLLNLDRLSFCTCHKFYLGQGNKKEYHDFQIIKLPDYGEEISIVIINMLDKYLCSQIS